MNELIKKIDVPANVTKGKETSTSISIYNDKVIAETGKGLREWNLSKYSKIEIIEASFSSNSQFAIIFFVTPEEEKNHTKISKMKFLTDLNCGIAFCSGMYSYSEANRVAREIGNEIQDLLSTYQQNNNTVSLMQNKDIVYSIKGVRGRFLDVYDNKCVITVKVGVGSFLTGNVSDGEKTIYYKDVIGVQYKKTNLQLGYLQLETASAQMNGLNSNFFNENSFTFDSTTVSNETMTDVADYVKNRVDYYHQNVISSPTTIIQQKSVAEELKEFKELLDLGIITVEEFDAKKKQLLSK